MGFTVRRAAPLLLLLIASCTSAPQVAPPPLPVAVPGSVDVSAAAQDPAVPPATRSSWAVRADDPWERVSITASGMLAAVNSSVRVGPKGVGVGVDLEELLGLNSGIGVYRLGGSWRFSENKRHRADLSWMAMRRSSETTLIQDLDLGDGTVLPSGTGVESYLNIDIIRATYSYSFMQDDRVDLAAVTGLYIMPIGFGLGASGLSTFTESFDITAPLPLFGLRADILLTPRWYLRNSFNLFYLEFGDYSGGMRELRAAVEYRATEWLGIGLGAESFGLAVQVDGATEVPGLNFLGRIDYGYTGLVLYARGYL